MSSLINEFTEAETGVFWDMVDCEIPNGVSLDLVYENIKSALADDGYRGKVSIRAYCDTKESKVAVASAFKSSGIKLVRAGDTNSRLIRMLKDLTLFAVDHKPSNLMIISQDISTESVYVKHLLTVKKSNHNLLLAQIDKVKGELLTSVSSIWYWKDLSSGRPAFQSGRSCGDDNNASEFAEAEMGIFWDVVDCEIPSGLSLDLVCENIKSALVDVGYRGKVSISTYCEMRKSKAIVASAFKSSGINLVCSGDRRARRNRMLEDLLFFAIDHKPSSLMVISRDISEDSLFVKHLLTLKEKNRNLLLAQIDSVTGDLFACASSIWFWADLANGGVPAFQSTSSCRVDDTSTSGSLQGVAATNEWNLKRCPVGTSTSGSSQGVANKRTSSTNESIQGPKRLRVAESTHSVVPISGQGPEG